MPIKFFLKNTKIVSTFGPAITFNLNLKDPDNNSEELQGKVKKMILSVFKSGVNCVRFNFSHGVVDENNTRLEMISRVHRDFINHQKGPRKYLRLISMMADTKGPEIRVFDMGSEGVTYEKGQEIVISCMDKKRGSISGFSVIDATGKYNMANDCIVGNFVLVEDGKLKLHIQRVDRESGQVFVRVMNKHTVKTNKRINLPGANYSMDFLSEKDIADIKYAIDNGFEIVALSFVNGKRDVEQVRELINNYCKEKGIDNYIQIYSKTETTQCCNNIDEIIEASDGIMIARGDLGLEVPYFEVPHWTKQIIRKCRAAQKPVITATQMLDSLERNVVATRAEVSDVYRAAEMGSDCTMLSGETAQGQFPVLSVETMTNIVYESEKHFNCCKFISQFESSAFHNLDDDTKKQILEFKDALSKLGKPNVVLIKYDDFSISFIKSLSSLRYRFPIFVFKKVQSICENVSSPDWGSNDYVSVKRLAELTLYRSINVILVEGEYESASLVDLFRECFQAYIIDCCPECCCKNMLCWEKSEGWKIATS